MPSFQPYHDVPGIEGYDGCLSTGPQWVNVDPTLELMDSQEDYHSSHAWPRQQRLHDLQQSIGGYNHFHSLQIPEENFFRLGLQSQWNSDSPDLYRQMRYLSPGGTYGATSATDSTTSEEAISPDAIRQYPAISRVPSMSHHTYYSPRAEGSFTTGNGSWTAQIPYSHAPPSSPYAPSDQSACNLKEIQYSHDEEIDEDRPSVTSHQNPFLQHQPEELAFADEGLGRSIGDEDSMKDSDDEVEEPQTSDVDSEYNPSQTRKHFFTTRAGRTSPRHTRSLQSTSQSTTSPTLSSHNRNRNRITKPTHPTHRRTTSSPKFRSGKVGNKKLSSKTTKQFPCTFSHYGCSSIFASKNEWKRHVASQHLQLGFYRCDAGFCVPDSGAAGNGKSHHAGGRSHNDFNRKDLFTQHWRRMHLPAGFGAGKYEIASPARKEEFDRDMDEVRARCWVVRREGPRRAQCGVCGKMFEGMGAWEERMEHLGRHFERGELGDGEGVREDEWLTEWAVGEAVVRDLGARGKWLAGMEPDEEENVEDGVDVGVGDGRVGRRERRTAVAVAVKDEDEDDDDDDED